MPIQRSGSTILRSPWPDLAADRAVTFLASLQVGCVRCDLAKPPGSGSPATRMIGFALDAITLTI
jgi:hypothetical protein